MSQDSGIRDQGSACECAMFAVDCKGRLAIDVGECNVALDPPDVLRLLDFLGAITYKGLVRRTDGNGWGLAAPGSEA